MIHPGMPSSRSSFLTPPSRPRRTRRPSYKTLENAGVSRASWKRHRDLLGRRSRKTTRVEVVVPTLQQLEDARAVGSARARIAREPDSQGRPHVKSEVVDDATLGTHLFLQDRIRVQVKREELFENDVRHRLTLIGYDTPFDIKIPRDVLDATTTRRVTSHIWGGSPRGAFPKINHKEFTHGLDDFMYTNLQYDPHAPRWPGSPGLAFRFTDDGQEWPKIMRLIVRLRKKVWKYMGQYKLTAAPPLTPNEWNAQSRKVKRTWAAALWERKSDNGLKARLVLQKRLGRDPTPQELDIALKSKENFHVSVDEILQAYGDGRMVVRVWCMKCVGYDVDFQQKIAAVSRGLT